MTARVRRWRAKTAIAATYASTGVVLLALALLVAFLLQPPLLAGSASRWCARSS
jgi:hypothetical protein